MDSATILTFHPRSWRGEIERITTRDHWTCSATGGWGSFPTRPAGTGWVICDARHDKRTIWQRPASGGGQA